MQESREFKDYLTPRPKPSGIDVLCGLKHFAIITYGGLLSALMACSLIDLNWIR